MTNGKPVIYIDHLGRERGATVLRVSPLHPELPTLGYFDAEGSPHTAFDVPHFSSDALKETNPDLPQYHTNCWKEFGETHNPIPVEHPSRKGA